MLDSEAIRDRINNGHYDSQVNARRAIGQLKVTKKEKVALRALVEEKIPVGEKEVRISRKKNRKRRSDGKVINGAGDSRTLTLFKLGQYPDAFALLAHLIAKAVDENTTLPELHDDVQGIAKFLKL